MLQLTSFADKEGFLMRIHEYGRFIRLCTKLKCSLKHVALDFDLFLSVVTACKVNENVYNVPKNTGNELLSSAL